MDVAFHAEYLLDRHSGAVRQLAIAHVGPRVDDNKALIARSLHFLFRNHILVHQGFQKFVILLLRHLVGIKLFREAGKLFLRQLGTLKARIIPASRRFVEVLFQLFYIFFSPAYGNIGRRPVFEFGRVAAAWGIGYMEIIYGYHGLSHSPFIWVH